MQNTRKGVIETQVLHPRPHHLEVLRRGKSWESWKKLSTMIRKRTESNSSSASSDEKEYQKRGAKPKKKEKYSALPAVLLTLPAQIQILMMRSVQSTGLIIGNLRKRAHPILRAPVLTLMMSSTFVQSTVLIIRSQRNGVEQHFLDCCQKSSATMVKPTGWHSSRSSLGMPLHANGLLKNV